jgi:hypothetical protein
VLRHSQFELRHTSHTNQREERTVHGQSAHTLARILSADTRIRTPIPFVLAFSVNIRILFSVPDVLSVR